MISKEKWVRRTYTKDQHASHDSRVVGRSDLVPGGAEEAALLTGRRGMDDNALLGGHCEWIGLFSFSNGMLMKPLFVVEMSRAAVEKSFSGSGKGLV